MTKVGMVVAGAAAAWLTAQLLTAGLALRPGVGPGSLQDLAQSVAAFGSLAGLLIVVLAPVAAVLTWALRRVRGGGAVACTVVGAAGGVALLALWSVHALLPLLISGALGVVCGVAGWAASSWAAGSGSRVVALLAVAGGTWGAAFLMV
jgi:hypothetical protein